MDDVSKASDRLNKAVRLALGKEKAAGLLPLLEPASDSDSPRNTYEWAERICRVLGEKVDEQTAVRIRENCSCIMSRNRTALVNRLRGLREGSASDGEYLQKVARELGRNGRCGKKVEYRDGRIYSHWQFGDRCVCHLSKGEWARPPSLLYCQCCKGSALSVYRPLFDDKVCCSEIVETFAMENAKDCVFAFWWE